MVDITIYSSDWCPYCMRAKALLRKKEVEFNDIVVDGRADLRAEMVERSGRTSVPQIWINGKHVGGCDELHALERAGELDGLLAG